jgi:hypothetical protein
VKRLPHPGERLFWPTLIVLAIVGGSITGALCVLAERFFVYVLR